MQPRSTARYCCFTLPPPHLPSCHSLPEAATDDVVAPPPAFRRLVVVQVTDVDDDEADEDLERDARDEQRENKVVEAVTVTADV